MIESITCARFPRDTNVAAGVVLDSVDVDQPLNTEVAVSAGSQLLRQPPPRRALVFIKKLSMRALSRRPTYLRLCLTDPAIVSDLNGSGWSEFRGSRSSRVSWSKQQVTSLIMCALTVSRLGALVPHSLLCSKHVRNNLGTFINVNRVQRHFLWWF